MKEVTWGDPGGDPFPSPMQGSGWVEKQGRPSFSGLREAQGTKSPESQSAVRKRRQVWPRAHPRGEKPNEAELHASPISSEWGQGTGGSRTLNLCGSLVLGHPGPPASHLQQDPQNQKGQAAWDREAGGAGGLSHPRLSLSGEGRRVGLLGAWTPGPETSCSLASVPLLASPPLPHCWHQPRALSLRSQLPTGRPLAGWFLHTISLTAALPLGGGGPLGLWLSSWPGWV